MGQIITFYSFKGGVGRSMAVANVAFIAACNGKRVLVMDWDLEAPGLSFYFRGLLEPSSARMLQNAPGVLNILWAWRNSILQIRSEDAAQKLVDDASSGALFTPAIQRIRQSQSGCLDFIGAGSQKSVDGDSLLYADALARFSWTEFYESHRGPVLVNALREWAKSNYDLVLIDSRTGLADVAGLCTMQLPDSVAMCFILNRQNIFGSARVAGAIRAQRKEQIKLHAVPMRYSRQETTEQSDAWSRAISEFSSIGGFAPDTLRKEMPQFGVPADAAMPFHEILAPFNATTAQFDPLTLNYVQLASGLVGHPLKVPEINPFELEAVRERLEPRQATAAYVKTLTSAEPGRAAIELKRFLQAAQEAVLTDHYADAEYIEALVQAALEVDDDEPTGSDTLQELAADLLRDLFAHQPDLWRLKLVDCLEHLVNNAPFATKPDELTFSYLEEIDTILAPVNTTSMLLRRLKFRRRAASLYASIAELEATKQTVGEIRALVSQIRATNSKLSAEQSEQIIAAEMDAAFNRGIVYGVEQNLSAAADEYRRVLLLAKNSASQASEISGLEAQANCHLALLLERQGSTEEAAHHALLATVKGGYLAAVYFQEFSQIVCKSADQGAAAKFLSAIFKANNDPIASILSNFQGRTPSSVISYFGSIGSLLKCAEREPSQLREAMPGLFANLDLTLQTALRRRHTIGTKSTSSIDSSVLAVQNQLATMGFEWSPLANAPAQTRAMLGPRFEHR